jgi:hypothetical protein
MIQKIATDRAEVFLDLFNRREKIVLGAYVNLVCGLL